ncbi:MAG: hypothetical protein NWF14_04100 [Candidatus Bathyarchaeota archaeon]|nr:hypothetical protein [Candidatus Bathyarchaeota archaeon]
MPTHSGFKEKVDVLDLMITILREHDDALSKIAERFDAIYDNMSTFEEKVSMLDRFLERLNGIEVRSLVGPVGLKGPLVTVKCKDWLNFRGASQGAALVAFEVKDNEIILSSITDLFVYTYVEGLPEAMLLMSGRIRDGFKRGAADGGAGTTTSKGSSSENRGSVYKVIPSPSIVKRWLSSELGAPEEAVIEGRVLR